MSATVADPRAARLAELWSRLSAQHVSLAMGCGCGIGGVDVRLEDFDRDIVDYLLAEAERLKADAVVAFLPDADEISAAGQPVRDLLDRLEASEANDEVADWLLTRLTRTLESFAQLHGGSNGGGT